MSASLVMPDIILTHSHITRVCANTLITSVILTTYLRLQIYISRVNVNLKFLIAVYFYYNLDLQPPNNTPSFAKLAIKFPITLAPSFIHHYCLCT